MTAVIPALAELALVPNTRGDPLDPPACAVFPALVLGVGEHGERIVHRVTRRLRAEDQTLLAVFRLCALSTDGTLQPVDGSGVTSAEIGADDPPDGDTLLAALRAVCEGLGTHRQMQDLFERGYTTFRHDDDLTLRCYLLGDAREPRVEEMLARAMAGVRAVLGGRGHLTGTALCHHDAPNPPLEKLRSVFDRVYFTSSVKQHGYLAEDGDELEAAHCLFVENMLLSDAERVVTHLTPPVPLAGTFGIASIRLGMREMEQWLTGRLVTRLLRDGYMAELMPEETGTEGRASEVRLRTHWTDGIRSLSGHDLTIYLAQGKPCVSLPSDGTVLDWCSQEADARMRGQTPYALPTDLAATSVSALPFENTLFTIRGRMGRMDAGMRADMSLWLRERHLTVLPGCLPHLAGVLGQWREMVGGEMRALAPDESRRVEIETETPPWLEERLDDIGTQMRMVRAPRWLVALCVLVGITSLFSATLFLGFHRDPLQLLADVVLLALILVAWRPVVERRRRRLKRRLLHNLTLELEERMSTWLRGQLYQSLAHLSEWIATMDEARQRLQSLMESMVKRYEDLGEQPRAEQSFLEQVTVDSDLCQDLYSDVSLESLFADRELRELPATVVVPAEHPPSDIDIEQRLEAGVMRVAKPYLAALNNVPPALQMCGDSYTLSLETLRAQRFIGAVEQLRGRALPFHRTETMSSEGLSSHGPLPAPLVPLNLLLVHDNDLEWVEAADASVGSPDYLRPVYHSRRQTVTYVRLLHCPA